MGRRYSAADSAIATLARDTTQRARAWANELRGLLSIERGIRSPNGGDVPLQSAALKQAAQLMSAHDHPTFGTRSTSSTSPNTSFRPSQEARQFTMQHVQLADAIAFAADTSTLRVLADSIEQIGARSFAGRDRVMHHHVRGIIAMREGNWTAAEEHFASVTEFGKFGSMRSLLYQARSQLERGEPQKKRSSRCEKHTRCHWKAI